MNATLSRRISVSSRGRNRILWSNIYIRFT